MSSSKMRLVIMTFIGVFVIGAAACSSKKSGSGGQVLWSNGTPGCFNGNCTTEGVSLDYGTPEAITDSLTGGTPSLVADTSGSYLCSGQDCRIDAVGFSTLNSVDLSAYAAGHLDFDFAYTSADAAQHSQGAGDILLFGASSQVAFSLTGASTGFKRISVSLADATGISGYPVGYQHPSEIASIYLFTTSTDATPAFAINDVVLRAD